MTSIPEKRLYLNVMDKKNTHVVIMAGGSGSRLWPVSTPCMPKQFIDLLGVGKTMIRLTMERFLPLCPPENFWVVTSERYVSAVREQLPEIPEDQILAEPEARNTAPCIAYACWKIDRRCPDANIVVTPADALVIRTEEFASAIGKALGFTAGRSAIVTVGIVPTRPETGYGYIHAGGNAAEGIVKVAEFKEKPSADVAVRYVADGHYLWNAGIFVWNCRTIMSQMREHAPAIAEIMDRLAPSFFTAGEKPALANLFPLCDKISIDYAVMEKSRDIYVVGGEFGWSDLGSWGAIGAHMQTDSDGNAVVGSDVRLFNSRNCIVHAADARRVVVEGLDGYVVAEKDGNILVCRISEDQHVKEFSSD